MNIEKLNPWNWFKKEEEHGSTVIPVAHARAQEHDFAHSLSQFHQEFDRLFEQALHRFGLPFWAQETSPAPRFSGGMLKPSLDLGVTDKEYSIAVEIPGVDQKDIKLEIVNDTLIIHGEKKQVSEDKGKNYYRLERSYGSFQRVLSLPEDADQNGVKARFSKGVLTVTFPRKSVPASQVKEIEVSTSDD
jgi:HSP20 family protein